MNRENVQFGTCSWNYDSWVGLVYPSKMDRAVSYLPYYAKKFNTAEIDSWFYRIPDERDVREYKEAVPESFRFTCKVPQQITLTHHRNRKRGTPLRKNGDFLSVPLFEAFVRAVEPLLPQIDAVMFEFESEQAEAGFSGRVCRNFRIIFNTTAEKATLRRGNEKRQLPQARLLRFHRTEQTHSRILRENLYAPDLRGVSEYKIQNSSRRKDGDQAPRRRQEGN